MVERKLARLDPSDRKLLQAASTQGISFDSVVAAVVLAKTSSEVEERLEVLDSGHRLVRFETMATLPDGFLSVRYRFVHALYQRALYQTLTPPRLSELSARTAEALLERYGENRNAIASEVAYLFEAACDWKRAAEYFLLASEEASRLSLQEKAAALARRAIVNGQRFPDSTPVILRAAFQIARAHQAMSEFEESIAAFELAERKAKQIGDVHSMVEAVCGAGVCLFHLRRFAQVGERGREALFAASEVGWQPGIAYANIILAFDRFFIGDLGSMRESLDRSSSVLAIPFDVIRILWMRALGLGNRGLFDHALSTLEEALCTAEINGDAYWLPRIPNTLAWIRSSLIV